MIDKYDTVSLYTINIIKSFKYSGQVFLALLRSNRSNNALLLVCHRSEKRFEHRALQKPLCCLLPGRIGIEVQFAKRCFHMEAYLLTSSFMKLLKIEYFYELHYGYTNIRKL